MGQRTRNGKESSRKIVAETERKKAGAATLETWFIPDPFSFHSELNLFPILPDPHFCSSMAHFMHPLQLSSLLHLHRLITTHRKNLANVNLGCVLEQRGGPEIAPTDTLLLQINNLALTGAGTGVQVLWQFYETLAVPCLCFSKSAENEMARFRANDTMVLNGMMCLFVSSQEGRRREGMYIWSDPNHFCCCCCFC